MNPCPFCSIVEGKKPDHKITWEDSDHLAFYDINPVTNEHTLLIPKKHFSNILDMDSTEYAKLMEAARMLAQKVKDSTNCHLVSMVVEGLSVSHVHVHLIPFQKGEDLIKFVRS
jgi:histidine triad (HIT) family protein